MWGRSSWPSASPSRMSVRKRLPMAVDAPIASKPVIVAGANHRTVRLIAIVAGLLGAIMAIATPLLPVTQTTAQLNWPQNGTWQSVDAPLIGYVATDLTINVPCQAAAGLVGPENRDRTVLLSTVPKQAPKAVDRGLLVERSGYDFRPQIVGVFTDLSGPAPDGLTFSATIDTRYSSSPTLLKMLAMIIGVAMTIVALGALHVLDAADGVKQRRILPPR